MTSKPWYRDRQWYEGMTIIIGVIVCGLIMWVGFFYGLYRIFKILES